MNESTNEEIGEGTLESLAELRNPSPHPDNHTDPCQLDVTLLKAQFTPNLPNELPTDPNSTPTDVLTPLPVAGNSTSAPATAAPATVGQTPVSAPVATINPPSTTVPISIPEMTTSPINQPVQQLTRTLATASAASNTARGNEVVASAIEESRRLQRQAENDQRVLAESYRHLPNDHLANAMQRARDALQEAADLLSPSNTGSIERSEQARFRNYFLNARDKAEIGLDSLREQQRKQSVLGEISPFAGLVRTPDANPIARTPELSELFGATLPEGAAATSTDALVNRLVMFNGLPPKERERMMKQLRLAEAPRITLPNGQTQTVAILHNGYILGGGNGSGGAGSALDCSSFVSSVLPADVRKGRFTTLDFRMMWFYLRTGKFGTPPLYESKRAKLVKETATAFTAIDIYEHETLAPGDLLIYRPLRKAVGHVFLVRSYNASTLTTEVVEAAQSAGTIREREFPLSVYPMNAKKRFLRPGLMALRIKPVTNRACSYREHRQASNGNQVPAREGSPDGTAGGAM